MLGGVWQTLIPHGEEREGSVSKPLRPRDEALTILRDARGARSSG